MSINLIYYILIAALRDKLVILVLLGAVISMCISIFLGGAAVMEQEQFSVVFASGILRLFGVCGLVLFCVSFMRRAFESKDIEFLLARPISKTSLILSYAAGFSLIAVCFALLLSAVIYVSIYDNVSHAAFSLWALSLCMEYIIVVNAALFFSMVITSTTGATMGVFGLYLLARMSGSFLGIIDADKTVDTAANAYMELIMQIVSMLTPRLDLMAQSSWLIYGLNGTIGFSSVILQGAVFSGILIAATLLDLMKKQF